MSEKSVKVKANESQEFKTFEVEIPKITWKKRCELNDMMIEREGKMNFSFWGDICLQFTNLKEEDLNNYSNDEIVAIANTVFDVANRKKK
tara:strand:- start:1031 stop:1300 length:270 start_codon:yes stop_codon:yes gene_type:complete